MATEMLDAFAAIGAEVEVVRLGGAFEIDITRSKNRERFKLTLPSFRTVETEVLDIRPKLRHLVLDVWSPDSPVEGRYLCGHDERHWFTAMVPNVGTSTVNSAMESLKPLEVRRAQKKAGVKHRKHRRKTAAYVRQGEWFFLPRPMMHVGEKAEAKGQLVRAAGGKPHRVDWVYRPPGTNETFVRGAVRHADHATIYLQVWHRVVQNTEAQPTPEAEPVTRMAYFD